MDRGSKCMSNSNVWLMLSGECIDCLSYRFEIIKKSQFDTSSICYYVRPYYISWTHSKGYSCQQYNSKSSPDIMDTVLCFCTSHCSVCRVCCGSSTEHCVLEDLLTGLSALCLLHCIHQTCDRELWICLLHSDLLKWYTPAVCAWHKFRYAFENKVLFSLTLSSG